VAQINRFGHVDKRAELGEPSIHIGGSVRTSQRALTA